MTLAAPAAVASLAYLRAKTSFPNDYAILKATVLGALYVRNCVKNDRVNLFYELEKHALDPKTRDHSFLAIPPHIPKDVATPADLKGLQATEWSYKQVYETVLKFAAWLKQEHGVKKGDMVAIDYTNKTQFVCLWFALFSLGAKAAFINTNLRGKALLHCVKACKAKLLIVDPAIEDALTDEVRQELANSVQAVVLDDVTEGRIVATAGLRVPDEERGGDKISDTAVLIFTSGTTGLPKPAVVPWKKFLLSGRTVSNWLGVKSTDRYYTVSRPSLLNTRARLTKFPGNAPLPQFSKYPQHLSRPSRRCNNNLISPLLSQDLLRFGHSLKSNNDAIHRRDVSLPPQHSALSFRQVAHHPHGLRKRPSPGRMAEIQGTLQHPRNRRVLLSHRSSRRQFHKE